VSSERELAVCQAELAVIEAGRKEPKCGALVSRRQPGHSATPLNDLSVIPDVATSASARLDDAQVSLRLMRRGVKTLCVSAAREGCPHSREAVLKRRSACQVEVVCRGQGPQIAASSFGTPRIAITRFRL
jgi:hypothetical protein